jgi:hypothetical protein
MKQPSKAQIERTRRDYPVGTRLELTADMQDPYAPIQKGTRGTVTYIDDMCQIGMQWDNNRSLSLIVGEDSFRKLTVIPPEIVTAVKKLRLLPNVPNMFSVKEVFEFAMRQDGDEFYELADFIFMNTPAYSHLILTGEAEF